MEKGGDPSRFYAHMMGEGFPHDPLEK